MIKSESFSYLPDPIRREFERDAIKTATMTQHVEIELKDGGTRVYDYETGKGWCMTSCTVDLSNVN
jgi:hypothetical protein